MAKFFANVRTRWGRWRSAIRGGRRRSALGRKRQIRNSRTRRLPAGEELANRVLLPTGYLDDGRDRGALRLPQQTETLSWLDVLPAFTADIPFAAVLLRLGADVLLNLAGIRRFLSLWRCLRPRQAAPSSV